MKTSTKIVAAATAALSLAAASLVFASPAGPGAGGCPGAGAAMGMGPGGMQHGMPGAQRMGGADMPARASAHLAALKAELKITETQEVAWQQYETVVRQQAESMQAFRTAMQARMADPKASAEVDPQAQHDAMLKLHESNLAARETARQALYAVLTPEQKTVAEQWIGVGQGHRPWQRHHAG